jgi:hypothetical protein
MESWQLAKRQLAKGYNYPNSPNLRLPDSSKNVNLFFLSAYKKYYSDFLFNSSIDGASFLNNIQNKKKMAEIPELKIMSNKIICSSISKFIDSISNDSYANNTSFNTIWFQDLFIFTQDFMSICQNFDFNPNVFLCIWIGCVK